MQQAPHLAPSSRRLAKTPSAEPGAINIIAPERVGISFLSKFSGVWRRGHSGDKSRRARLLPPGPERLLEGAGVDPVAPDKLQTFSFQRSAGTVAYVQNEQPIGKNCIEDEIWIARQRHDPHIWRLCQRAAAAGKFAEQVDCSPKSRLDARAAAGLRSVK